MGRMGRGIEVEEQRVGVGGGEGECVAQNVIPSVHGRLRADEGAVDNGGEIQGDGGQDQALNPGVGLDSKPALVEVRGAGDGLKVSQCLVLLGFIPHPLCYALSRPRLLVPPKRWPVSLLTFFISPPRSP